jgi:hypothetical protein
MNKNLLRKTWANLDSFELKLFLDSRIGGPGQTDRQRSKNADILYLPLARSSCRISLTFGHKKIEAIEPGPAFDAVEWERISEEIERSILAGPLKIGREYSFHTLRVVGSWRGDRSGVQILPAPDNAPRAHVESADHPFILEFPITASDFWPVTNHRRRREHGNLTLLLNVLLAGRTSLQSKRSAHFWACVPHENNSFEMKWVQQCFLANLNPVVDEVSPPAAEKLEEIEAARYYAEMIGRDGKGLRVPDDLDEYICVYLQLSPTRRAKFDRATFWMDLASRQWATSVSASFASLVSAIESLTDRGTTHRIYCPECKNDRPHDVPGATEKFRDFFEKYAPDASLRA